MEYFNKISINIKRIDVMFKRIKVQGAERRELRVGSRKTG
jgi:hypothetical protein